MKLVNKTDGHDGHKNSSVNNIHLLIVDDDPDIIDSLNDLFEMEKLAVDVITASTEEKARTIAETESIDIALLDIQLGEKNGLDLVPLLKQRNKHVVCLMMTAYRDIKYAVSAIRFGADDYLYKPLEPAHLVSTIKRYIKYQDYRKQRDRAESWFRIIFDTSDHLMFISDLSGNLHEINGAATEFCGLSEQDIAGKKMWELQPWAGSRRAAAKIRNAFMAADSNTNSSVDITVDLDSEDTAVLDFSVRFLNGDSGSEENLLIEGRDITRVRQTEQSLRQQAYHDELTGLPNRTQLMSTLSNKMAIGMRRSRKFSLLFIDLDHFKSVNDQFGHDGGDLLLQEVTRRMNDTVRGEDIVARYSGDEFIAILNETDDALLSQVVAERLRDEISRNYQIHGETVTISCSIGIAIYPDHGTDPEELIRKADDAMYQAKREGRDRYCLAH